MQTKQCELNIERLAYGGEGIARLNGKIAFVENALPGETVLAEILEDKKKFLKARAVEIITASPARITPVCRYAARCGGCQYQHVSYEEELKWKEIQVREHLSRNLGIPPELIRQIVPSSSPFGNRISLTLHFDEKGKSGFIGTDNTSLVPIEECLLASPLLQPALNSRAAEKNEDVTYRLGRGGRIHSSSVSELFEIEIGGEILFTHSKGFFQNNLEMTYAAARALSVWISEIRPDVFLDLYAGAGTFSLLSASAVPRLAAMEESIFSLQALKKNLERRKGSSEIIEGKVEKCLPGWLAQNPAGKKIAFLDPPRKGMSDYLSLFLSKTSGIDAIVYLSCHLGTLARDLKNILAGGKFSLRESRPFDMFPRTKHIEVLTLLTKI